MHSPMASNTILALVIVHGLAAHEASFAYHNNLH